MSVPVDILGKLELDYGWIKDPKMTEIHTDYKKAMRKCVIDHHENNINDMIKAISSSKEDFHRKQEHCNKKLEEKLFIIDKLAIVK